MKDIKILWVQFEKSSSCSGEIIGYKTEDGLLGCFTKSKLKYYKRTFNIIDVEQCLKKI